jgi:glucosamine--fructose-6-phosphate aminotransferase (isomerizing)
VALKMKETSYLVAEPYSPADLLHGPVAMIDRGFPALVIAPSGRVLPDLAALMGTLAERHAELVAISDDERVLARARVSLRLPGGVPEWLSPVVAVVPGQLWAAALARSRGLDPDRPRGLSKVTETL